jgi:hypothetical protein
MCEWKCTQSASYTREHSISGPCQRRRKRRLSSLPPGKEPQAFTQPARGRQHRASLYLHRPPWRRHSTHSSLSSHIFPNGFLEPATRTPQNNRVSQPQPGDPLHPPQPLPRLPVWDNHLKGIIAVTASFRHQRPTKTSHAERTRIRLHPGPRQSPRPSGVSLTAPGSTGNWPL